ncbi:MAG: DnaJ domain-containing protein, partial [Alphaproteobacteria bacterium]
MQWFLIALLVFVGAIVTLRWFTRADVKVLVRNFRRTGGIVALGLAVVFGLTGRIALAVPLAAFGMMLLGRSLSFGAPGFMGQAKSPGQRSRVRAARVEMTLDHDSGDMDGVVIGGPHDG